ncbi:MAG: LysE family translocator [Acinetobacter sp.]
MWHMYGTEFLTLVVIHFLAVILPGPDFAITVQQSVRYGKKIGCWVALGIGMGISIHVFYTLVGIGTIMQHSTWLMSFIRCCGAAYLIYLGWKLLRSTGQFHLDTSQKQGLQPSMRKAFMTGFMTNALNPKATIFFLAIFTTIVQTTTPIQVQIFYGLWMCVVNALWFMLVSIFFAQPFVRQRFLSFGKYFEWAMGIILIAFALRLLLTTL